MSKFRSYARNIPVITRTYMAVWRAKFAMSYYVGPLLSLFGWVFQSRETDNFTYDLTPTNKRYLVALLATVTKQSFDSLWRYCEELDGDDALRRHVFATTGKNTHIPNADREARWGRRIGWYILVRALKPKVVIETGVDKGLGSCVLTAAIMRNAAEGHMGYYYGTDLNPKAGYLLTGEYARHGKILYGDSIESLRKLGQTIDLFINDSDHSAEYEGREYETIAAALAPTAFVLGDNAHVTDKLIDFALRTGRSFVFFQERPLRHWYPGAGIGIAFPAQARE